MKMEVLSDNPCQAIKVYSPNKDHIICGIRGTRPVHFGGTHFWACCWHTPSRVLAS